MKTKINIEAVVFHLYEKY